MKMRTMSSVLPANFYLLVVCIAVLMLGENYSSAFVTTLQQSLLQRQNKYALYYLPIHNNDNEHYEFELEHEQNLVYFDIMRRTNNHNHNYNKNYNSNSNYYKNNKFENEDVHHPLDRACHALMMEEEHTRGGGGKGGSSSFEDDLTSQIKMWQGWDAQQGQGNEQDGFY